MQEEIAVAISIPPPLLGRPSARPAASGKALDKEYKVTAAVVKAAHETAIKAVRKALIVGAIVAERSATEVASYAERIVITWPNDFDSSSIEVRDGDMEGVEPGEDVDEFPELEGEDDE